MLAQTEPLELLAQDALVPTVFLFGATGLGSSLDAGCGSSDLQPGTQVSVPLWMLKDLHQRGMVEVKLPAVYTERYRRKLNAGAECVSLKNIAPYFYDVGNQLNELMKDVELAAFLARTFKTRYHELISRGLVNMSGEEVLKLSSKLSVEEQQLFEGGHMSMQHMDQWWKGAAPNQDQQGRVGLHPVFKRAAEKVAQSAARKKNKA